MKAILWALIVGSVVCVSGCRSGNSSYVYSSADKSYSVTFPAKPTEKTMTTPTGVGTVTSTMVTYAPALSGREYICSATTYPFASSQFNVEKGLDGARDGAARNVNGTITKETRIDLNGVQGRECEMTVGGTSKTRHRFFADASGPNPTLYQVIVTDRAGNVSDSAATDFLLSLKLNRK